MAYTQTTCCLVMMAHLCRTHATQQPAWAVLGQNVKDQKENGTKVPFNSPWISKLLSDHISHSVILPVV